MCKVAQRIADQYGVSEKTIRRDSEFATAVDYLGLEQDILTGSCKLSKSKIVAMYHQAIGKINTDNRVSLYVKVSPGTHAFLSSVAKEVGADKGRIIDALAQDGELKRTL